MKGSHFIGHYIKSAEGQESFSAVNPATNEILDKLFYNATAAEIDAAIVKAISSFPSFKKISGTEKAVFLDMIASLLLENEELVKICVSETGLPEGRIMGERLRTVNQLKLFATLLEEGSWVEARIDTSIPDRKPLPRADIRSMLTPIGPVAIFGASNFPLAFSVAGGDTVAAFAAGCPVVFKAHPLHPETSSIVAETIIQAAIKTGMPDGIFSMVHGNNYETGLNLVKHPGIRALAFTGSLRGGMALFHAANQRPEPIPVYAEMGSTNPVFILPGAARVRGKQIAEELSASITMGVGQFCTNPGIFIGLESPEFSNTIQNTAQAIGNTTAGPMLSLGMQLHYNEGLNKVLSLGAKQLATGTLSNDPGYATPYLLGSDVKSALANPALTEEIFGPCSIAFSASDEAELIDFARSLQGHLTATIHAAENDLVEFAGLISILEEKVGRLIYNGYPTGVEVCHAMMHGGPFPATTDSRSTSVGTASIKRFTRPIAYQQFPDSALPPALKNANSLKLIRLVNGKYTGDSI